MRVMTREQVRAFDKHAIEQLQVPGIVLMENAGRNATDKLLQAGVTGKVLILCGAGNNGGDGLVIARQLDCLGHAVHLVSIGDPESWTGDAGTNYEIAKASAILLSVYESPAQLEELAIGAEWILDALLGTGARGAPRSPYDEVIRCANKIDAKKMAIDIPSGLDCNTGHCADPTFRAQLTVTFVAAKPGLIVKEAADYVGRLEVVGIGVKAD